MDPNDDAKTFCVPVRPYSAEVEALQETWETPRSFRPTPPSERKQVDRAMFSSVPAEATAESLLQAAWRKQEIEGHGSASHRVGFIPDRFQGMSLEKFGLPSGIGTSSSSTCLPGKVGGVAAPRKAKQKEGGSMELMDLAFTPSQKIVDGQVVSNYAPISLPYFHITEEDEKDESNHGDGGQNDAGGSRGARKKRPTATHVDEINANAAKQLFLRENGDLLEDQLFLLQLPAVLPELLDPSEEVQREREDASTAGAGATISRLPDGKLGKLKIYKSGKVRMEIGGIPFCVDQGCDTFFQQDLACVCPLASEIISLGPIRRRMVMTPDVESMLQQ